MTISKRGAAPNPSFPRKREPKGHWHGSKCVIASYRILDSRSRRNDGRFRGNNGNRRLETEWLKLTTRPSAGESITVADQGMPVAEIRLLPEERREPYSNCVDKLEQYLEEMRRQGILGPPSGPWEEFKATKHIPGALERFLAERE